MGLFLITIFLAFSFIGWFLDSTYRSLSERKWINAGYFRGPFCPIYGFGGATLFYILNYTGDFSILFRILIATFAMILVEFLGGVFSEKVLKIKLWDYSSARFHINGKIDLIHSFYWLFLVVTFYFFIYPILLKIEEFLRLPLAIEIIITTLFFLIGLWLTFRKAPKKFLVIKGKFANITLEKYSELHSKIQKMRRGAQSSKNVLKENIKNSLKGINATLRDL